MGNKQGKSSRSKASADALKRFQSNTGLMSVEAKELSRIFEACNHGTGHVTREEFQDALGQLEQFGLAKFRNLPMGQRLFDQFDLNKDGKIDLQEFMSGFLLLCKGSDEDKLDLTFRVFDKDGNGRISKEELVEMYTSTYRALIVSMRESITPEEYRENENARKFQDEVLVGIEEKFKRIMETVSKSIYSQMDSDNDGQLSKEEFRAFVMGNPFVKATYEVKVANNAEVTTKAGCTLTAEVLLSFLNEEDFSDSEDRSEKSEGSQVKIDDKSDKSDKSRSSLEKSSTRHPAREKRIEKAEKSPDKEKEKDKKDKSPEK